MRRRAAIEAPRLISAARGLLASMVRPARRDVGSMGTVTSSVLRGWRHSLDDDMSPRSGSEAQAGGFSGSPLGRWRVAAGPCWHRGRHGLAGEPFCRDVIGMRLPGPVGRGLLNGAYSWCEGGLQNPRFLWDALLSVGWSSDGQQLGAKLEASWEVNCLNCWSYGVAITRVP